MRAGKLYASILCATLLAGGGANQTALAQDEEAQLEELIVTGSRIRDANVVSSSQITTIQVEDIADRGITRIEDYLNDLPQISPG